MRWILRIFVFLLLPLSAQDQERKPMKVRPGHNYYPDRRFTSVEKYVNFLFNEHGVVWQVSDDYEDLGTYVSLCQVSPLNHSGLSIGPRFMHEKGECILATPAFSFTFPNLSKRKGAMLKYLNRDTTAYEIDKLNREFARKCITKDIKGVLGTFGYYGEPLVAGVSFDFDEYVTVEYGRRIRRLTNADTLFIYDLDYSNLDINHFPFDREVFPYCKGVVLTKKNRANLMFKFFFTEKGIKKSEKYMRTLYKSIRYEDDFLGDEFESKK